MAISTDKLKKKKDNNPKPATQFPPMKPFGKGLKSPKYSRRNPHKDQGDKKPSLKTKASIIKDKAKKGQGLARGGMVKSIIKLIPGFAPTPKSGTVSTIQKSASAFVKRRQQTGPKSVMPIKKKDGGEIKERIQKFKMKMNPQDFDLKTGARLTEKDKTDRMRRSRDKIKSKPKRKMF